MNDRKSIFFVLFFFLLFTTNLYAQQRGLKTSTPEARNQPVLGNYYAVVVGINAYKEWYPLKTAINDVRSLKEVLINHYGFEKVLLITDDDATQFNVINTLKKFAAELTENDNLLIYFAGHGQLDVFTGDGYWIPVDGKPKDSATWISHLIIKSILCSERINAKNIALISDSCYAGALLRSGSSPVSTQDDQYEGKILALSALKSRQIFTSGGLEPVADSGRDGHSLFAYYFLKALWENKRDIIDLENLFYNRVWGPVTEIGNQRPYIGRLRTLMDENGQFVLVTRSARNKEWDQLLDQNYLTIFSEQNFGPAGKPSFNPAAPWTGIWDVEGSRHAGPWAMIQKDKEVISTRESLYELSGTVQGNQLTGRLKTNSSVWIGYKIVISSDSQSFEGEIGRNGHKMGRSGHIKGKRKE